MLYSNVRKNYQIPIIVIIFQSRKKLQRTKRKKSRKIL